MLSGGTGKTCVLEAFVDRGSAEPRSVWTRCSSQGGCADFGPVDESLCRSSTGGGRCLKLVQMDMSNLLFPARGAPGFSGSLLHMLSNIFTASSQVK